MAGRRKYIDARIALDVLMQKDAKRAIRTAPAFDYNNEINHTGLKTGDQVQITGNYVQGTGLNGTSATYVWVFAPKYGVSGYVNAAYLG